MSVSFPMKHSIICRQLCACPFSLWHMNLSSIPSFGFIGPLPKHLFPVFVCVFAFRCLVILKIVCCSYIDVSISVANSITTTSLTRFEKVKGLPSCLLKKQLVKVRLCFTKWLSAWVSCSSVTGTGWYVALGDCSLFTFTHYQLVHMISKKTETVNWMCAADEIKPIPILEASEGHTDRFSVNIMIYCKWWS